MYLLHSHTCNRNTLSALIHQRNIQATIDNSNQYSILKTACCAKTSASLTSLVRIKGAKKAPRKNRVKSAHELFAVSRITQR